VLPLNSYALSPTMLPATLGNILQLLLWNSLLRCLHIPLDVFSILISCRNQIRGRGLVFHFSNPFLGQKLLDRERLVSWIVVMVENQSLGQISGNFLSTASYNRSNIST